VDSKINIKKPPKVTGLLYKLGNYFNGKHLRLIEIDPVQGFIRKFTQPENYPNKPSEKWDIQKICKIKYLRSKSSENSHYFCFKLSNSNRIHKFLCNSEKYANVWISYIKSAVQFVKYCDMFKKLSDLKYFNTMYENLIMKANERQVEIRQDSTIHEIRSDPIITNEEEEKIINSKSKILLKNFEFLDHIGSGAFGRVFKVRYIQNNQIYALKAISKAKLLKENTAKYALAERNILPNLDHPFLVKLYFAFQTPKFLYLVIDYCSGGDLVMHLHSKENFTESECKFYLSETLLALESLHLKGIAYRDMKPDNILIFEDGHIKLADFGLAKNITENNMQRAKSFCGSPAYLSPEMIIKKQADTKADIYGLGAVFHELLTGLPPFWDNDNAKMYSKIANEEYIPPSEISLDAQNLLIQMMIKDPEKRPTATELKKHKFFSGINWEKVIQKKLIPPINPADFELIDNDNKDIKLGIIDEDYKNKEEAKDKIPDFSFKNVDIL